MTAIEEDKVFMGAICENPFDVSSRQQYVDWLIEHEDPKADFIDLQCRNLSLNTRVNSDWLILFEGFIEKTYGSVYKDKEVLIVSGDRALIYRNGFVDGIKCNSSIWYQWGPKLVLLAPITNIHLLNKEPYRAMKPAPVSKLKPGWVRRFHYNWFKVGELNTLNSYLQPGYIPSLWFENMYDYCKNDAYKSWLEVDTIYDHTIIHKSSESALRNLSNSLINWARKEAGLPEIDWIKYANQIGVKDYE